MDNKVGFKMNWISWLDKMNLGTDALKEIVQKYRCHKSTIFIGFINDSKAFDWVNHYKLFNKLIQRGAPDSIVRILAYW